MTSPGWRSKRPSTGSSALSGSLGGVHLREDHLYVVLRFRLARFEPMKFPMGMEREGRAQCVGSQHKCRRCSAGNGHVCSRRLPV